MLARNSCGRRKHDRRRPPSHWQGPGVRNRPRADMTCSRHAPRSRSPTIMKMALMMLLAAMTRERLERRGAGLHDGIERHGIDAAEEGDERTGRRQRASLPSTEKNSAGADCAWCRRRLALTLARGEIEVNEENRHHDGGDGHEVLPRPRPSSSMLVNIEPRPMPMVKHGDEGVGDDPRCRAGYPW